MRNSKGFLQTCTLAEQRNVMIAPLSKPIFTYRENTTKYRVRVSFNSMGSFHTGLCYVRHTPSTTLASFNGQSYTTMHNAYHTDHLHYAFIKHTGDNIRKHRQKKNNRSHESLYRQVRLGIICMAV